MQQSSSSGRITRGDDQPAASAGRALSPGLASQGSVLAGAGEGRGKCNSTTGPEVLLISWTGEGLYRDEGSQLGSSGSAQSPVFCCMRVVCLPNHRKVRIVGNFRIEADTSHGLWGHLGLELEMIEWLYHIV